MIPKQRQALRQSIELPEKGTPYFAEKIVNVAMMLRDSLDELVEVVYEAPYLRSIISATVTVPVLGTHILTTEIESL